VEDPPHSQWKEVVKKRGQDDKRKKKNFGL